MADRDRVHGVADFPRNGYRIRWMLRRCRLTPELIAEQLAIEHEDGPETVAGNPYLSPQAVEALMDDHRVEVRRGLAARDDLTPSRLRRLMTDSNATVRTAVSAVTLPRHGTNRSRSAASIVNQPGRRHRRGY